MLTRLSSIRFLSCLLLCSVSSLALAGIANPQTQNPAPPKKVPAPAAAPPAPVSKHYPILLIAAGAEQGWSARIGMKGVERLERAGYPPITLDPGEIAQEAAGSAWMYHAKDAASSADVVLRLTRESCTDGTPETKYQFRAVLNHTQIGELRGCAKIAADQFPEFRQKNLDDDDPDKKKVVPPAITGFKSPTVTTFVDAAGKVMLTHGDSAKEVAAAGYQPSLSHDGKRLLFTQNLAGKERKIVLYEPTTGKTTELLRGLVAWPFFSPNDANIAFMKLVGTDWQVWTMPTGFPEQAAQLSAGGVWALHGWLNANTVIASDAATLYFLRTEGPATSIPIGEVYREFERNSTDTIRANPLNPDLLLVSAMTQTVRPGMAKDPETKMGSATFLYEIKSKRQVVLTPPNVFAQDGEWSRDGLQIFFTDNAAGKASSIWRIFWDGSGLKRLRTGSSLVAGP
jgi:uncharacterized membrane protein